MGEMADYYLEQELFGKRYMHHHFSKVATARQWVHNKERGWVALTWTTADGKSLLIRDMTDQHLLNCIHMLERKYEASFLADAPTYQAMVLQLIQRDQICSEYFELDLERRQRVVLKRPPQLFP